jgi:CRP-like cAMP-binding protein
VQTETVLAQVKADLQVGSARASAGARKRAADDALHGVREAWSAVLGPGPLAPDLMEQLLVLSNPRDLEAGRLVLSRQEMARSLSLLVHGDVGFGVALPETPFHPERSVRGPAWLDISSAWLGRPHAQDALAFSDVRVVNVSRNAYQALMSRHAELARRIVIGLAGQLFALTETTHDLMHKDADARLAAWLLQRCVADAAAPQQVRVVLHERKRDIASQLAITPETLSRLLRQLRSEGLIEVHGYRIGVLKPEALRERAQA